jgi:hypothetical protein
MIDTIVPLISSFFKHHYRGSSRDSSSKSDLHAVGDHDHVIQQLARKLGQAIAKLEKSKLLDAEAVSKCLFYLFNNTTNFKDRNQIIAEVLNHIGETDFAARPTTTPQSINKGAAKKGSKKSRENHPLDLPLLLFGDPKASPPELAKQEELVNRLFPAFVRLLFVCHHHRNKGLHECAQDDTDAEDELTKEWPCPFLQEAVNGQTVLPLGRNFNTLVGLFVKNEQLLQGVAEYLKGLQAVLQNERASDDQRESALDACEQTVRAGMLLAHSSYVNQYFFIPVVVTGRSYSAGPLPISQFQDHSSC